MSPAGHSPDNSGCTFPTYPTGSAVHFENQGARNWAISAVTSPGGLLDNGYTVRVGKGPFDHNWNDSRAWGNGHLHIPIHSNVAAWQCSGTQTPANNGTWGIYRQGASDSLNLAWSLLYALGPSSPGTDDKNCFDTGLGRCTNFNGLQELNLEQGITAGYLEQEMHTWSSGVNYLVGYSLWDDKLADGVNLFCFLWPWEC